MTHAVIAATGLFTPEQSISNEELVAAYNAYAEQFNIDHAAEILEGDVAELTPSSVEFIEKASGIKSRFVLDKAGVLDPARMAPN
ncbi:MAG TPA: beta-ketoacyl-ACP synthase III, partial [Brevundimonas sp.]|nr:beta-ketoacyl-ACP synthase III [Brevundimonas sp.]